MKRILVLILILTVWLGCKEKEYPEMLAFESREYDLNIDYTMDTIYIYQGGILITKKEINYSNPSWIEEIVISLYQ